MQATRLYACSSSARIFSCIVACASGCAVLRDDHGSILKQRDAWNWRDVTCLFQGLHVGLALLFRDARGRLAVATVKARFIHQDSPLLSIGEGRCVVRMHSASAWNQFVEVVSD